MDNNADLIRSFKPSYVWPNPAFHFRLYFESDKCRIFLIENIAHNWIWLEKYKIFFEKRDFFIVQLGWYFDEHLVNECHRIFEILNLDKNKFYFMYPDFATQSLFEYYGFNGKIVNHNCFLDENLFQIKKLDKIYDAVYTARRAPFKRHFLANKVSNLALIAGDNSGDDTNDLPPCVYINDRHLSADEVIEKLSQSKVGLILSEFEGACYSSSEYLLCGIPVVSTKSHGGREIWYNSYNSIICEANPDAIAESVTKLASLNRDPFRIRQMHIATAMHLRLNFIEILKEIFSISNESIDPAEFFKKTYKHKMLTSETPDFDSIFSVGRSST